MEKKYKNQHTEGWQENPLAAIKWQKCMAHLTWKANRKQVWEEASVQEYNCFLAANYAYMFNDWNKPKMSNSLILLNFVLKKNPRKHLRSSKIMKDMLYVKRNLRILI